MKIIGQNIKYQDSMKQKASGLLGGMVLFFLLLLGGYFFLLGQQVIIAESQLEKLVRSETGRSEGRLFRFYLKEITELDASGLGITDLAGIEHLRNLEVLNLEDNAVSDLTPLRELRRLADLSLRNNGITDLEAVNFSAVAGLPLERLSLRHNVVRPEEGPQARLSDISLLASLVFLKELELRDNHIENISPLKELGELRILDISQNPLRDGALENVSGLTRLRELNIRETGTSSLVPIKNLEELVYLNIHSNRELDTIAPVAGYSSLEVLIARNVPIKDEIVLLSNLERLWRLNIRNCGVKDVSVLASLMERGALQDDLSLDIRGDVDIRENPIPVLEIEGYDGYAPLRPYWDNITRREPRDLP